MPMTKAQTRAHKKMRRERRQKWQRWRKIKNPGGFRKRQV